MAALASLGPWPWLIGGLLLIGLETLAPGIFLVWFGIAAVLTGALESLLDLTWPTSLIVFAVLALASAGTGRLLTRRRDEAVTSHPMLNRRGDALVGRVLRLDRPIAAGEGRVRVDDSVWRVTGPELAAGAPVRVVRVDGATLVVEPAPG